jgi:hypothetical protein
MITKEELLKWQHDEAFQLKKIKEDGYRIKYIRNPSEKVCLEAVKQNGYSIQYIHNPSKEVCLEAVKQNGTLIQYIHDPSKEICLEALTEGNCDEVIKHIDIEKYPDIYEKYCFMKI